MAGVRPSDRRILDVGTGTGLIALMMAQRAPEALITGVDVEEVSQARENAAASPWGGRVVFEQCPVQEFAPDEHFDLIVSNPPYVDAEDFADMPAEYQHEPALGLACGDDGLDLVRRMLAEAANHLTERGTLIVEVGNSQVHVEELYPEVDFTWLEFEQGGHGVFLLAAAQCREYQKLFRSRAKG